MSLSTLESLVKSPDLWDFSLNAQTVRDVLLELASRVDALANSRKIRPSPTSDGHISADELDGVNARIDEANQQIERQGKDFTTELRDMKEFFNFQLRDIRESMGHKMASMKSRMKSETGDESGSSQQDLANEVIELQDKLRAVIATMGDSRPLQQIQVEAAPTDDDRLAPIEIPETSGRTSQRQEDGEVTESGRQSVSQPVSPRQSPEPALSQRISRDPRVDWMQPIIDQLKADRKSDVEKLNTTIRTVNKLIVELEAQKQKLSENVEVTKGFQDEFERLYGKMAQLAVDQDKKVNDVAEAVSARESKEGKQDMSAVEEMMKKMRNVIQDNLEIMDQNYKREIGKLKKEIATLKKGQGLPVDESAEEEPAPLVFDRGLGSVRSRDDGEGKDGLARRIVVREIDFPDSVQYCEAIVQTEESEMKPIPVFRQSTTTSTKLPGVIVTQEIVDRDPVSGADGKKGGKASSRTSARTGTSRKDDEETAEPEGEKMEFMEKYTVDDEDKEMKKFVFGPSGAMTCERMLSLTIVSDYDGDRSVNALVHQVLEDQYNMSGMKTMVDRHNGQISTLAMDMYNLLNPTYVQIGRAVAATLTSPRLAENLDFDSLDDQIADMDVVSETPSTGFTPLNSQAVSTTGMSQSIGAIPIHQVIPGVGGQAQVVIPTQGGQQVVIPTQNGQQVVIPTQNGQQVVIPTQNGQQVVIPTQGGGQPQVVIPPQGGQPVVIPTQGAQQVVIPSQGGQAHVVISTPGGQQVMIPVQNPQPQPNAPTQGQQQTSPAASADSGMATEETESSDDDVVLVPADGQIVIPAPKAEKKKQPEQPTQPSGEQIIVTPHGTIQGQFLVPTEEPKPGQAIVTPQGQVMIPVQQDGTQVLVPVDPTQGQVVVTPQGQVMIPVQQDGNQVLVPVPGAVVTGPTPVPSLGTSQQTRTMSPLAGSRRGRTLSNVEKTPMHVLNPTPMVPGSSSMHPDQSDSSKVDMSIQTRPGATPPKSPVRTRRQGSETPTSTPNRRPASPSRGMVLVVNADTPPTKARLRVDPNQAESGGVQAADVDAVNDRLDQIDGAVSALEYQLYNLQKSIINKGAMRLNSARADDGRPYALKKHGHRGGSPRSGRESADDRRRVKHEAARTGDAQGKEDDLKDLLEIKDKPKQAPTKEQPATTVKESSKVQYKPLVPGSLHGSEDQKGKQMVFADSLSIDPDFEQVQATQEAQKPEEISIPKYEDQFRILREAVVELRTNMQMLKIKSEQPVMLPTPMIEQIQASQEQDTPTQLDDAAVRALRRKLDAHMLDFQSQIQDLRRELYEFMAKPLERVIEKVVPEKMPEPEKEPVPEKVVPDAPPVKDINVEMNILKAKAFLGDFDEDRVMKITNLGEIPDLDVMDASHRDKKLIIEEPLGGPSVPKPLLQPAKPGASTPEGENRRDRLDPRVPIPSLPARAPTRNDQVQEFVGRDIPQVIEDLRVLNSVPKDKLLEALLPYIVNLRADLQLQIENAAERLRRVELAIPMKIDKEFVDAFFRKIRLALQETNERVIKIAAAMPDKVSQDDVEEKIAEALKVMVPQDTTAGGKSNYTCLLCGAKRTGISNPSHTRRGHIFKGRAAPASSLNAEAGVAQLPPLRGDE